ncbi:hypothetical protein J1614_010049 [Plenodomus biglobosus]|nr:hypothetical protein J1614_010049 [Plenodomus biglobosus]
MLRLRPSELTLTPEDVEDTFRRLAQRQAARASAMAASRGSGRHERPVIRRGPQRSLRDAITAPGDISLYQHQPQYATITVADRGFHNADQPVLDAIRRDSLTTDHTHVQTLQAEYSASSSGPHCMLLPFRPGLGYPQSIRHETSDQSEASLFPAIPESSRHTAFTATESDNTHLVQQSGPSFRPVTPTDDHADLRGGAGDESPSKSRARMHVRAAGQTPSPLCQAHRLESPLLSERSPDPVKATVTPTKDQPIRHLEGYFKSPLVEPYGLSYHFRERISSPQSEPRPRRGREIVPIRSLSSGSAPPFTPHAPRSDGISSSDETMSGLMRVIRLTDQSETAQRCPAYRSTSHGGPSSNSPPAGTMAKSRNIQRQSSSEASAASAAFSYYGSLPSGSRHSSSGMSGTEQLSPSQYDGAITSRETGSAVHHRVRSLGVASNSFLSSSNAGGRRLSPDPRAGYSPLPSSPYTRTQGERVTSQTLPVERHTASSDDYPDATEAAARNLRSPLDDYSEQYQRLVGDQYDRGNMPEYPPQIQPTEYDPNRSRRGSGGDALRTPYATLPTRDHQARPQPSAQIPRQHDRSHQAARANQRSSENNPVTSPSINSRSAPSQVQTQRAAYELLQNASRAMQTTGSGVPSPTSPHHVSNRERVQGARQMASRPATHRQEGIFMSSSPPPLLGYQHQSRASAQGTIFGGTLGMPPPSSYRLPPQYREGLQRTQTRIQRQVSITAVPSLHLHPSRDSPLTSLALDHGSGVTSRRSRSPLVRATTTARTHRRVPAHQRDQENSAEAEIDAMRREQAAVNARYGENGQQETMDETPPRIGRFERAMFE